MPNAEKGFFFPQNIILSQNVGTFKEGRGGECLHKYCPAGICSEFCVEEGSINTNTPELEWLIRSIGDVANSKRPLLIIPKVQLRLRVTCRSANVLARYPQKLAKIVCG